MTSRMDGTPVRTMTSRSSPMPRPPVGGLVAGGEVLHLLQEALALVLRVVELGEGVAELHAGDVALETLHEARVVRRLLGEGARLQRMLGDEDRLDELG